MDSKESADVVDVVLEQHVAAKKGLTEVASASIEQKSSCGDAARRALGDAFVANQELAASKA